MDKVTLTQSGGLDAIGAEVLRHLVADEVAAVLGDLADELSTEASLGGAPAAGLAMAAAVLRDRATETGIDYLLSCRPRQAAAAQHGTAPW